MRAIRVVRTVETVRFHGKNIEKLPPGEIRRALEGHVERQRRFPLDTANALRGRLRREGFTIFKKARAACPTSAPSSAASASRARCFPRASAR
ncbi:MAG: hypothetical protein WDM96_03240 [Lacunisphaera sp.]